MLYLSVCTYIRSSDLSASMTIAFVSIIITLLNCTHLIALFRDCQINASTYLPRYLSLKQK